MPRTGRPKHSVDVRRECRHCGKPFIIPEWKAQRGGFYCSMDCYNADKGGKPHPARRTVPTPKICPTCGKEFLTGGGGRPPRRAKFCSAACMVSSPRYHPEPRVMSEPEAAWLAALIDGEGSIVPQVNRSAQAIRITVHNTCLPLLERIAEITATGQVRERTRAEARYKRMYTWGCYGWNARALLRQCLPWLIVKRDKALAALGEEPGPE